MKANEISVGFGIFSLRNACAMIEFCNLRLSVDFLFIGNIGGVLYNKRKKAVKSISRSKKNYHGIYPKL